MTLPYIIHCSRLAPREADFWPHQGPIELGLRRRLVCLFASKPARLHWCAHTLLARRSSARARASVYRRCSGPLASGRAARQSLRWLRRLKAGRSRGSQSSARLKALPLQRAASLCLYDGKHCSRRCRRRHLAASAPERRPKHRNAFDIVNVTSSFLIRSRLSPTGEATRSLLDAHIARLRQRKSESSGFQGCLEDARSSPSAAQSLQAEPDVKLQSLRRAKLTDSS